MGTTEQNTSLTLRKTMYSIITSNPQGLSDAPLLLQPQQTGISPRMLKALVGMGHPEFSSNRQQDALEFLRHLIGMVEVHVALRLSPTLCQISDNVVRRQFMCNK